MYAAVQEMIGRDGRQRAGTLDGNTMGDTRHSALGTAAESSARKLMRDASRKPARVTSGNAAVTAVRAVSNNATRITAQAASTDTPSVSTRSPAP